MRAAALLALVLIGGPLPAATPRWVCFGNEPSWSLRFQDEAQATLAAPGEPSVALAGTMTRRAVTRERMWRGRGPDGDVVAFIAEGSCSDGMSDTRHPARIRVSLPDGRFLAGCCRRVAAAVPGGEMPMRTPEGAEWIVTLYDNIGRLAAPLPDTRLALRFQEGALSGNAGCNALRGPYTLDGPTLSVGSLATTRKACTREGVMAQEQAFLAALRKVASWRSGPGGGLEMLGPGSEVLVRAAPAAR